VANPYPPIDRTGVEFVNGVVASRVLPYADFFSLFTKLPLGHTKAAGKNINIGVIGDNSYADWIYFVARDAQVYTLGDLTALTITELVQRNIKVAALSDFRSSGRALLERFVQDCSTNGISVLIEGDLASTDMEIQTANSLEQLGAISVGRVDRQGTTYYASGATTTPFNARLREINITAFTVPIFSSTSNYNYRYALFGMAGALAMKLELGNLDPAALKAFVIAHSRSVWQMYSIDGLTNYYFTDITVDSLTSQYIPTGPHIYYFRLLDFQYLLDASTSIPWNANIFNLTKAWSYGRGNVDVAVIDASIYPDAPAIAGHVVEKRIFGNISWNGGFHGTSMAKALLTIAPEAKLHMFLANVFNLPQANQGDYIAQALDYCIQQGIKIVSMSFAASLNTSVTLIDKIRQARDAGVTVIWFHFPQAEAGIIRPQFTYLASNMLATFDRFIEQDMFYPQEIQAGLSYTSPQVAGLVALIKEKYPNLTPVEVETMLKDHSVTLSNGALIPDMLQILQ
jgi:hypothetical protein